MNFIALCAVLNQVAQTQFSSKTFQLVLF